MKGFLRGRNGAAIELALYTMLAIFGFCLLLTTVSLLSVDTLRISINASDNRYRYAEVGEQFLYTLKTDPDEIHAGSTVENAEEDPHTKTITVRDNLYTMTYSKNGVVKLVVQVYVKLEDGAAPETAEYIITRWNYGDTVPETDPEEGS